MNKLISTSRTIPDEEELSTDIIDQLHYEYYHPSELEDVLDDESLEQLR